MKTNYLLCLLLSGALSITSMAQISLKKPKISIGDNKSDNTKNATQSPAQTWIDACKKHVETLDNWISTNKWSQTGFENEMKNLEEKTSKIKEKDPKYDVSEFESKLSYFKTKHAEKINEADNTKIADTNKKKEEELKNKSEAEAAVKNGIPDEGITNPIHEKNLGKIVFSSSEIDKTNPDESKFGTNFPISNPIYLRIYLKKSIYNEVQANKSSKVFDNQVGMLYKVYLDGTLSEHGRVEFSNEGKKFLTANQIKTETSIGGAFNFNKDAFLSSAYIDGLKKADAKLTEGKHTMKIELFPIYNSITALTTDPMASGELTLNISKGFVNASNQNMCLPKAVKKDPALETKYKELVKKYIVNNNIDATLKSFVLLSSDWEVSKDEYTGKPISRTMYGAAGLSYKDGRCMYETFSFTQNWAGGSFSATYETSKTNQDGLIFCDCLK